MPTYLVHGFRWPRWAIRIYIARQDLEDAASDWIVAPATSVTLLNSFYTLYDFLPPSSPPPSSYALPAPHTQVVVQEASTKEPPRRLTKRNTSSRASLKSSLSVRARRSSALSIANTQRQSGIANGQNGDKNRHGRNGTHLESPPSTNANTSTSTLAEKDAPSFNDWSVVKILEQYNPADMHSTSQPYAYVGDYFVKVELGVSIPEEMAKYDAMMRAEEELVSPGGPGSLGEGLSARDIRRKSRRLGWFEKLRDGVHKGAEIEWFVVVCGDEERVAPEVSDLGSSSLGSEDEDIKTPRSAGLRGFFGKKKTIREE
ncbi:uncharacterized protein BP5553_06287 [Venustampulla echinocandica]|uniref:Developmental regulator protein n=1 Tax=Venustampulla echinocandica TaxID=2656787 RepID=A0A370TJI6_9HELO|nr:uncharacterized protein BP5553_06287 [Venustampulla echinocandica]RDL35675.1 hypothetical protein BP5553_06287 [Venustampulla echinocandica]